MTKEEFIILYQPHIRLLFDYNAFLDHKYIMIETDTRPLATFSNYYTPWFIKNGQYNATIAEALKDEAYHALTLGNLPQTTELQTYIKKYSHTLPAKPWPVPIITDSTINQTIVLDGNHTLAALLGMDQRNQKVPVIELSGHSLQDILIDFKILYRQRSLG